MLGKREVDVQNMKFFVFLLGVLTFSSWVESKVTVCYYTNWAQYRYGDAKFLPENVDAELCTHVLYAFAQIDPQTHEVKNYEWNDDSMIARVLALKQKNPNLKVLISVGGWNHEKEPRYTKMVQTAATRKIFIDSLLKYMSDHHFDGFDIDWEYPGNRGSPAGDKEKYTTLLSEVRSAFQKTNPSFIFTASVAAGRPVIKAAYEINKIKNYLDWINLMAYDLHGSWENVTGHSTAMTGVIPTVPDSLNAWLEGGMPPSQIALGLATYGRSFTLQNSSRFGLGALVNGPGLAGKYTRAQGFLSYYEVCSSSWDSKTDWQQSKASAPFASKGYQWVGYETPESIKHKVETLVNGHNLHGVAIWALDLDDFGNKFCNRGPYPIITTAVQTMMAQNKEHIRFHPTSTKKSCFGNPRWRSFKNTLDKWCREECLRAKYCAPWMCICF